MSQKLSIFPTVPLTRKRWIDGYIFSGRRTARSRLPGFDPKRGYYQRLFVPGKGFEVRTVAFSDAPRPGLPVAEKLANLAGVIIDAGNFTRFLDLADRANFTLLASSSQCLTILAPPDMAFDKLQRLPPAPVHSGKF